MTDKLSYTPKEAAAATGVSYTGIRDAIANGDLEVHYPSAKRGVIRRAALEAWLESLPTERQSA